MHSYLSLWTGGKISYKLNSHLNILIADFTVFYQKLRHYHWNVKGPQFFKLHEKFEEIYTGVGNVIDDLAKRVVSLDGVPLHTLAHMLEETTQKEDPDLPASAVMVTRTIQDMETLTGSLQEVINAAEDAGDRSTTTLLDDVIDSLEAHLWMLKAWEAK